MKAAAQSPPEISHHGGNSAETLLLAMVCVHSTAVMRTREQSEMVVHGIPEASAAAEVLYEVVRPLLLGGEVAAHRPW
jgi:hypothetical protein